MVQHLLKPWRCWPDVCAPAVAVVTLHQCGPPLWHSGCKGCEGDMDIATRKATAGNSWLSLCFQHLSLPDWFFVYPTCPWKDVIWTGKDRFPINYPFWVALAVRWREGTRYFIHPFWWELPLKPSISVGLLACCFASWIGIVIWQYSNHTVKTILPMASLPQTFKLFSTPCNTRYLED